MKTALDLPADALDEHETKFVAQIRRYGWFGTHVSEDEEGPGFSYTTGFWHGFRAPEVMLFTLPSEIAHEIFWGLYHGLESGERLPLNQPVDNVLNDYDVIFRPVPATKFARFFGWSRWFYRGDDFEVVQLVWPDRKRRFPWTDGAPPEFLTAQPLLSDSR